MEAKAKFDAIVKTLNLDSVCPIHITNCAPFPLTHRTQLDEGVQTLFVEELANGTASEKYIQDLLEMQFSNIESEIASSQPPPAVDIEASEVVRSGFIRSCDIVPNPSSSTGSTITDSSAGAPFENSGLGALPRTPTSTPTTKTTTAALKHPASAPRERAQTHTASPGSQPCCPRRRSEGALLETDSSSITGSMLFTDMPTISAVDTRPNRARTASSVGDPPRLCAAGAPDVAEQQTRQLFRTDDPPMTADSYVQRMRAGNMTRDDLKDHLNAMLHNSNLQRQQQRQQKQQYGRSTTSPRAFERHGGIAEIAYPIPLSPSRAADFVRQCQQRYGGGRPLDSTTQHSWVQGLQNGSFSCAEVAEKAQRIWQYR